MREIGCQIQAIASHAISRSFGGPTYSESELLSIRLELADALSRVDDQLRWRRLERQETQNRAPRTGGPLEGMFG